MRHIKDRFARRYNQMIAADKFRGYADGNDNCINNYNSLSPRRGIHPRRLMEVMNKDRPVWQKSFHDRVIRDEDELAAKQNYIISNSGKWAEDRNNPICY